MMMIIVISSRKTSNEVVTTTHCTVGFSVVGAAKDGAGTLSVWCVCVGVCVGGWVGVYVHTCV